MSVNAAPHFYQFAFCPPCWSQASRGFPHTLAALVARQRFTCDAGVLVLHFSAEETDHTVSMVCGAHYGTSSVSNNLLEAPLAKVRQAPPPSPVADEVAYHEALLAGLDINTQHLVDALNDLAYQVATIKDRRP